MLLMIKMLLYIVNIRFEIVEVGKFFKSKHSASHVLLPLLKHVSLVDLTIGILCLCLQ